MGTGSVLRRRVRGAAVTAIAIATALALGGMDQAWACGNGMPTGTRQLTMTFEHMQVTLTVPAAWHLSATRPPAGGGGYQPRCILETGDYVNPYSCELMVGGDRLDQNLDAPLPGWRFGTCRHWTTTYEADQIIDSISAAYRIDQSCTGAKSEQWTLVTVPTVAIWHPMRWGPHDAMAYTAAHSAIVSGVAEERLQDFGRVRNVIVTNGVAYLVIDRVVISLQGTVLNHNPRTYAYRIHTKAHHVVDPLNGGCVYDWLECTATELRAQFLKGPDPSDSTPRIDNLLAVAYRDRYAPGQWFFGHQNRLPYAS